MKKIVTALITFLFINQICLAGTFEEGQAEIDKENYLAGYKILEPLAQQNNAEAQYIIGRLMTEQLVVSSDPNKGVVWLEKAIENRHMKAAQTLARMYLSGFVVTLDTQKGAHYLSLADEFRPEDEEEEECD